MYCNRLHAWWSTQSRLPTLLSSLIARRWIRLQTLCRFDLKTYLLMRWKGPDALAVARPTGVDLLDLFCSGTQFYVLKLNCRDSTSLLYIRSPGLSPLHHSGRYYYRYDTLNFRKPYLFPYSWRKLSIVGEPRQKKCKPLHPKGIQLNFVWLQGNSMVYMKPLYSRLDRLA